MSTCWTWVYFSLLVGKYIYSVLSRGTFGFVYCTVSRKDGREREWLCCGGLFMDCLLSTDLEYYPTQPYFMSKKTSKSTPDKVNFFF